MRGGAGQQGPDTEWTVFLALFLVVVGLVVVWTSFHEQIATAIVLVKGEQARLVKSLGVTDYLDGVLAFLERTHPAEMSPSHLEQISRHVGSVTRWVYVPALVLMAICLVIWMPSSRYRSAMSLDDLLQFQAALWTAIKPVVGFNPGKQDEPSKNWARALKPIEWLKANSIELEADGTFAPELVEKAFAAQLGEPWEGPGPLPPHLQGLLIVFALAGSFARKKEAEDLLGVLNEIWAHGPTDEATTAAAKMAEPYLADRKLLGPAIAVANRHAWVSTAMAGLLAWAIEGGGILNSGLFVWLRGVDRRTWYVLNCVGRATFHIEGAGAMCHFMAEQAAGGPIDTPEVSNALEGLLEYLDEHGYLKSGG